MVRSEEKREKSDYGGTRLFLLGVLAAIVLVVWALAGIVLYSVLPSWTERGQFGDMFGAINCLFSGLAFAGVIYTIYLQRHELSLQRKELELTRSQLARAADAQEKSEQALALQVRVLRDTAQLSALGSIIEHYSLRIARTVIASERIAAEKRQLDYIDQLEARLQSMKLTED